MFKSFFLLVSFLISLTAHSQTGPGNVGTTNGNSDLSLWLNLDGENYEVISSGSSYSVWNDLSGNENHLFAVSEASAPQGVQNNDLEGLYFDGNDFLQSMGASSDFNNTEQTVFVVASETDAGTIISIAANTWDNELLLFNDAIYHHSNSGNFSYKKHQCLKGEDSHPLSVMTALYKEPPDGIYLLLNNTPSDLSLVKHGMVSDYHKSDRKLTLGQRAKFVNSEYLNGNIYEVIVYNRTLFQNEIDQIHRYLRCKYDLSFDYCSSFPLIDCTNLEDPEINNCDSSLTLYPTITSDYLKLTPFIEGTQVSIYNSVGQSIVQNRTIDKSSFPVFTISVGVYFLQVDNECGQKVFKFIKY